MEKKFNFCGLAVCLLSLIAVGCSKGKKKKFDEQNSVAVVSEVSQDDIVESSFNSAVDSYGYSQIVNEKMDRVYFQHNSSVLSAEHAEKVRAVAAFLLKNPELNVNVEGFCDDCGSIPYNIKLSAERAAEVRKVLVEEGVPANRIKTVPFGKGALMPNDQEPVVSNKNWAKDLNVQNKRYFENKSARMRFIKQ
ncbi:OmpA family protein [Candidatus Gromoviella agglomerans]|uniref:OmpA family protein n=1 Tax=Candidatus Gromoviella agglomerans TaxID=2806609 RepID=UPI001E32E3F7|nr:OmpA family protein [Candidatus Gromoviella agglomerans]UFX98276.1 OmpA family protein [Candidatus Gromoviella agglomerans]